MQEMGTAILILVACCAACTSSVRHSVPQETSTPAGQEPEILCDRVIEIKAIPFKNERVNDAAYSALINAGEDVLPCLIEKVADTTPMHDPRGIPGPIDTKVGDVAFFVMIDIAKLDFDSMMPPEVKIRLKEEGVYAYHKFVSEEGNRKQFQSSLREWYRQKFGTSSPQHNKRSQPTPR